MKGRSVTTESGTVVDHIPCWQAPALLEVLKLKELAPRTILLLGQTSKTLRAKDLVVFQGWGPTLLDEQKIALLAPGATINRLEDGEIVKKYAPRLPELVEQLVVCTNSRCITNAEDVPHRARTDEKKPSSLQCYYCDHKFSALEAKFL